MFNRKSIDKNKTEIDPENILEFPQPTLDYLACTNCHAVFEYSKDISSCSACDEYNVYHKIIKCNTKDYKILFDGFEHYYLKQKIKGKWETITGKHLQKPGFYNYQPQTACNPQYHLKYTIPELEQMKQIQYNLSTEKYVIDLIDKLINLFKKH